MIYAIDSLTFLLCFFKSLKDFANYPMKENAKFSFKSRINSFNDLEICPKLPGLSDPFREGAKI